MSTNSFDEIAFGDEIESSTKVVPHGLLDQIDVDLVHGTVRREKANECRPIVLSREMGGGG